MYSIVMDCSHVLSSQIFFTFILVVEEQTSWIQFYILIIFKMAEVQVKKGQKQASGCRHFMADWDSHHYFHSCRDNGKGDDVCVVKKQEDCYICLQFTPEQEKKLKAKKVQRKIKEGSRSKELEDSLLGVGFF